VVDLWPIDLAHNSTNNKVYCANYGDTSISVISCYPGSDIPIYENQELNRKFSLGQNYPNPFNPTTTIEFVLARSGQVKIEIFNILGEKVRILVDRHFKTGRYLKHWDGKNDSGKEVSSGVYLCRFQTKDFSETKKMILLR